MITKTEISQLGHQVRAKYSTSLGNCRNMADVFCIKATELYDIDPQIVEVQVGDARETHFVVRIYENSVQNALNGDLLVDMSIDQFCTANFENGRVSVDLGPKEYLPEVGIYEPNCEERLHWYWKPKDNTHPTDVFAE